MNKVKAVTTICGPLKMGFRVFALLLLMVFIGRITLVSVYGYAGVQRSVTGLYANSSEQEDNDKKEEGKHAEKQFKCFGPSHVSQPAPVYCIVKNAPPLQHSSPYISLFYSTVLTPPPNC
ncbi:hypothetical protein ACFQ3S_05190 [Mucilaginibacter terrae]|uniref:hypothetical protein n=1 Tax=Mucilaginibacter terrae TaxID=1955052 RepID=UPI00362CDAEA